MEKYILVNCWIYIKNLHIIEIIADLSKKFINDKNIIIIIIDSIQ